MEDNILDTVGSPLVRTSSPPGTTVAAKVDSFNPSGSAKVRIARRMVREAEREGLAPDATFVEATSGNTGVGLACVTAVLDYGCILVMPHGKLEHNRRLMRAYGADIELVEGTFDDAKARARELGERPDHVYLWQSGNPANPRAHYHTTAEEIIESVGDRTVNAFVAGVGTGGTISGTGRRLREEYPGVEIVGVEPAANPLISEGVGGCDEYKGIGGASVPENVDRDVIDRMETVPYEDAVAECRRLAREEGLLVGETGGASHLAALDAARRLREAGVEDPLVVTFFWDSGERYLEVGVFD